MPSNAQIHDWDHRYDRDTRRPIPSKHDVDFDWRVIKSISNPDGGFNGGIDLVENDKTKELAVRKRLRLQPDCDKYDSNRWRREMLILRKLSHHNIPYYIDGFYTPVRGSIYMQSCRLGSLSDFIESGSKKLISFDLLEYFLWYVMHEVAEAILYLQTGFKTLADADSSHRHRDKVKGWVTLVHGDIRPDQIFLNNTKSDPGPFVLLGDFGFSQFIKPWHDVEVHDGPGCRSSSKPPEFPDEISEATDIFGLGVTAQLCLVSRKEVKKGLKKGRLRELGLSRDLEALICSCVASKPHNRPTIRKLLKKLESGLTKREKKGFNLTLLAGPLFKRLYSFPSGPEN